MPGPLFVLLPPSEAKAGGGVRNLFGGEFDVELESPRCEVVAALATLLETSSRAALEKVLGVRGPLLERALISTRAIVDGEMGTLPAWQRYSGVVWTHLDPATLSESQRRRLLVPSGLYGVTSGVDRVADYRLKMNASLIPLGKLSSYWKPLLTPLLEKSLRGATVIDLLPHEHEAALDFARLRGACEVHNVAFVQYDGARAAGHDAKAVKGEVARTLLCDGWEGLEDFRWNGWRSRRHHGELRIVGPAQVTRSESTTPRQRGSRGL